MTSATISASSSKIKFRLAIGAKLDGIVGYNFLGNYKVVIDYPGETLTLF
jgi:hypothetical protein